MDEPETRKKLIDKQLERVGWLKKYIKEELNSVKSDFKNKEYVLKGKEIEKSVDHFIDYLLLDQQDYPLAIIEAKKVSEDPTKGRIQSRTYLEDIEKQLGHKIPIFLTNGEVWYYIDQKGRGRKVSDPFSQSDLERRNKILLTEKDPSKIQINETILDRPRCVLNVKKLSEHFAQGHRKALIQMATGTGKTRVAMALIDVLVKADIIRNVLFIADRITLADQASNDGFKRFFGEPACELHHEGFKTTATFYSTTVQTLMGREDNRMFEKFSPGFFDLIIFDEAHRSIYGKVEAIRNYFDAIQIGLTATPSEIDTKNTYDLFDCEFRKPTVEYPYDDAVRDEVLVNYTSQSIATEVLSLGIKGKKLSPELQDQLRKQECDPEQAEFTGPEFDKVFMDDKTNELIVREFLDRCRKSDEGLPCKTIFFCASQKHAKRMKVVFERMAPNLANNVQAIISEYRSQDEVRRFKNSSEPRIALSVGMLDTGVDIPEVCNLVFVKPVYSHIRFWQMLGRGTRNLKACKHPEWLANREKNDFLILDFMIGGFSNVIYHKLKKSKEKESGKNLIIETFKNRVSLLKYNLDDKQKSIIYSKIMDDVNRLNEESFIVREKLSLVKKIKKSFDLKEYIDDLQNKIAPLMMLNQGSDPKISYFIIKVEKLFKYILEDNKEKIEKSKDYVQEMMENILRQQNITEVQSKKDDMIKVMQEEFWEPVTFDKVEFIIKELAPLMKYYKKDRGSLVEINAPDKVLQVAEIQNEIEEDPKLKKFIENNPYLQKIKSGEGITSKELLHLESQLTSLKPAYTIENVQNQLKKDFLIFIHQIIGLTQEYDPKEIIERQFDEHIIKSNRYNSKQIDFLLLLKKFFAEKKHIRVEDFADAPLSEQDPLYIFNVPDIEAIVAKCNKIKMR